MRLQKRGPIFEAAGRRSFAPTSAVRRRPTSDQRSPDSTWRGSKPLRRTDDSIMAQSWTWQRALSGVVPPLISPLDESGEPDAAAMAKLVEHALAGGCTGLFVLGGCGEGAWLTTSQRGAVIRAAVRAAAGRVPLLVGCMLPATGAAAEAARQAE